MRKRRFFELNFAAGLIISLGILVFTAEAQIAANAAQRASDDAQRRIESFEKVWSTVNEKHYDPTFGGVDWAAVRVKYEPLARSAKTDAELHGLLRRMLSELKLSHFGRPFDEADVRGVCGIAQSTKDQHSIGRFGIGFKSVYTFTDRPEIHSGEEDLAVENYVQPKRVTRTERADDETQIVLPLKSEDATAQDEITAGFKRLGPGALLFLRHIDEIN